MIKNFTEFLNEWNMAKHWTNQRASSHSKYSRIHQYSNKFKDGWKCEYLLEVNADGNYTKKEIDIKHFLEKSKLSQEEFSNKVTKTLEIFLNGEKAKSKFYRDSEPMHRLIYIGKIAFKVGDKFYSPVFKVAKGEGNIIWGDIKDNVGVTVLYYPENYPDYALQDQANNFRLEGTEHLSKHDYLRRFKIDYLNKKNFTIVIPDDSEWELNVQKQSETGEPYKLYMNRDNDPVWKKWKSYFKEDAQAAFDNGTILYTGSGRLREISHISIKDKKADFELLDNGKIVSKKSYTIDDTVFVVVSKESDERKDGNLPDGGVLVKKYKIARFFEDHGRKQIGGQVLDIFVLQGTEEIFSTLQKPE